MRHTRLALERPVTAVMLFMAVPAVGLISARLLRLETFPDITFPGMPQPGRRSAGLMGFARSQRSFTGSAGCTVTASRVPVGEAARGSRWATRFASMWRGRWARAGGQRFVVEDSARWAQPEEDVKKLVPNYPLLWAMLGVARMPDGVTDAARYQDAKLNAWRLVSGADTVEFARIAGPPLKLVAEVRQGGERIGRVEKVFADDGTIKSSRLDIPRAPARLDLTYVSSSRTQPCAADIWARPEP